jgi:hypothetical protein
VQGHLVLGLLVYAFDNVDFAVVGPVGAEHPAARVRLFFFSFAVLRKEELGFGVLTRRARCRMCCWAYGPGRE